MKLTKKELLRRIKITKPYTVKSLTYCLLFLSQHLGISLKENNK